MDLRRPFHSRKSAFRRMAAAVLLLLPLLGACGSKTVQDTDEVTLELDTSRVTAYALPEGTPSLGLKDAGDGCLYLAENDMEEKLLNVEFVPTLYKLELSSGKLSEIALGNDDQRWSLAALAAAPDGGFWAGMYDVPDANWLGQGEGENAILVRFDADGAMQYTIDLNPYAEPYVVANFGGSLPAKSEKGQEYLEENMGTLYDDAVYSIADLVCDDDGNVYVSSSGNDTLVFGPDGALLARFDGYDADYSSNYLVRSHDGAIWLVNVSTQLERENTRYYRRLDVASGQLGPKQETDFSTKCHPLTSPDSNYDVVEWDTSGIYGLSFSDGSGMVEAQLLTTWEALGIPTQALYPNGKSDSLDRMVLYSGDLAQFLVIS